ncbi:hypothetical protein RhiirC2_798622 [Rhizophagus irregularis]|uniref:Uncharacterized protein n=1 Tax=Rhizophagus irregularis TaxID=588596 RepID=A0A2N1M676_9GLOM|nr:hypothetical protein RhiirC2_798622 [Rhizophagus irregularis]
MCHVGKIYIREYVLLGDRYRAKGMSEKRLSGNRGVTVIRGSRCLSPKTITKISKLAPSLEMIVIRECKDILTDFQDLYPKTKRIFKAILFENNILGMQNMAFFSDKLKNQNQEEIWEAMKEGHVHHTVKALIDTTSCSNFISKSSCWGVCSLAPYENLIVNAFITLLRC